MESGKSQPISFGAELKVTCHSEEKTNLHLLELKDDEKEYKLLFTKQQLESLAVKLNSYLFSGKNLSADNNPDKDTILSIIP